MSALHKMCEDQHEGKSEVRKTFDTLDEEEPGNSLYGPLDDLILNSPFHKMFVQTGQKPYKKNQAKETWLHAHTRAREPRGGGGGPGGGCAPRQRRQRASGRWA